MGLDVKKGVVSGGNGGGKKSVVLAGREKKRFHRKKRGVKPEKGGRPLVWEGGERETLQRISRRK